MVARRLISGRQALGVEMDMRTALYDAARAALVPLLRHAPDRPAHVARDGRPPGRPLLPRLRPDLLLPEHPRRRLGHVRPLLRAVGAGADRAGDRSRSSSSSPTGTATSRTRRSATSSRSSPTSSTVAQESIVGVHVVKAFAQEPAEEAKFDARSEAVFEQTIRANRQRAFYVPLISFVPMVAQAAVLLVRRDDGAERRPLDRQASSRSTSTSACSSCRCARSACGSARRSARPPPASGSSR